MNLQPIYCDRIETVRFPAPVALSYKLGSEYINHPLTQALEGLYDLFPGAKREIENAGLIWTNDPLGKPYLSQSTNADLPFSVPDIQVSNSHDGAWSLVAVSCSIAILSIGIDIVHLPRLAHKSKDYLIRLASKFMSRDEHTGFLHSADGLRDTEFRKLFATHFSMMEAASKALGTGLKIGMGIGARGGLPMTSIGMHHSKNGLQLSLGHAAKARLTEIGGNSILCANYDSNDSVVCLTAVTLD